MIYFAKAKHAGLIKIGSTVQLSIRIVTLAKECGEPLEIVGVSEGGLAEERSLHRKFSRFRHQKEWFHPDPQLMLYIAQHATPWDGKDEVEDDRIRVYFDAEEKLKLALKTKALRAGVSVSAYIEGLLTRELADEIKEAEKVLEQRSPQPRPPKRAKEG